ncbi:hypothetical protein MSG28_008619 [Choristoneura fumiferana]|uniref:Uncharacterized protein n=1 Tax=Choristoneura fumiferana TaxID=7141 RepID=A0ACC0J7E3_CHOFU|nr:hypothetical protein MSG28_008619 [Choristoneura fumiferana]
MANETRWTKYDPERGSPPLSLILRPNYIYIEQKIDRPFLVTYVRSSLLFVYLVVLCFSPPTRDPCRPADYTQLLEPTAETDEDTFFTESNNSLGDSTFVPVRAGETTDSDDAAPRAVRFNKVAEVRVMSAAQAGEALLARLSWAASVRASEVAQRRAAAHATRRHLRMALLFALPWFISNYLYRLSLRGTRTGSATLLASAAGALALSLGAAGRQPADRLTLPKLCGVLLTAAALVMAAAGARALSLGAAGRQPADRLTLPKLCGVLLTAAALVSAPLVAAAGARALSLGAAGRQPADRLTLPKLCGVLLTAAALPADRLTLPKLCGVLLTAAALVSAPLVAAAGARALSLGAAGRQPADRLTLPKLCGVLLTAAALVSAPLVAAAGARALSLGAAGRQPADRLTLPKLCGVLLTAAALVSAPLVAAAGARALSLGAAGRQPADRLTLPKLCGVLLTAAALVSAPLVAAAGARALSLGAAGRQPADRLTLPKLCGVLLTAAALVSAPPSGGSGRAGALAGRRRPAARRPAHAAQAVRRARATCLCGRESVVVGVSEGRGGDWAGALAALGAALAYAVHLLLFRREMRKGDGINSPLLVGAYAYTTDYGPSLNYVTHCYL